MIFICSKLKVDAFLQDYSAILRMCERHRVFLTFLVISLPSTQDLDTVKASCWNTALHCKNTFMAFYYGFY